MRLYAVTIRGKKYYFRSNLSNDDLLSVESFCRYLTDKDTVEESNEQFNTLLSYIRTVLKRQTTPTQIEHVFRINYQTTD